MDVNATISTKPIFSIGITDLVFITKKSGDLNTDTSTYGRQRMAEGIRLHQKIQNSREDNYQSEVFLNRIIEFDEFVIEIQGRADGMNLDTDIAYIEEIKSHVCDYKDIEESQKSMHWTQLYFYGYMLTGETGDIDELDLHLSYIQVESEMIHTEKRIFKTEELNFICEALLKKLHALLMFKIRREKGRNKSLKSQTFPLADFRKGQRELSAAVYRTLKKKEKIFIEAPTGMGKTIGCLFPALKAMGEDSLNQIFFLTAKGTVMKQL